MSVATLILGEPGTGKTSSMRNLDPSKCLYIAPMFKPFPFKPQGWSLRTRENADGNVFITENINHVIAAMIRSTAEIVIVDDCNYFLTNIFMARRSEKGFDKFSEIGGAGFDIFKQASGLSPNRRVYVFNHTNTDDQGFIRAKTLGRLLDDKVCVEGMFTIVLRTKVDQGNYFFSTHNSGFDTVKSPIGMFAEDLIPNDLAEIDAKICDYYGV